MNNDELVKVTLIKVKIGSREIELTPDEARRLSEVLNDLIGPKTVQPVYIPVQPYPKWNEPFWVNPNVEPWPNHWEITRGPLCQTNSLCINAQ